MGQWEAAGSLLLLVAMVALLALCADGQGGKGVGVGGGGGLYMFILKTYTFEFKMVCTDLLKGDCKISDPSLNLSLSIANARWNCLMF